MQHNFIFSLPANMYLISLCTLPASLQLAGWNLFILLGRVYVLPHYFGKALKIQGNKDTDPQGPEMGSGSLSTVAIALLSSVLYESVEN